MKKTRKGLLKRQLTLVVVFLLTVNLYAQDSGKRASVHFKQASLRQVFTELEKQFGLSFSYNETNVALYDRNVTMQLKDATASQVLNRIFTGSPLTWSFKGNLVILTADPNYQKKQNSSRSITEVTDENSSDSLVKRDDLNEVVVVGYGRQSRKYLTSAISTVKSEEFNQGNFNNPAELLQGKVAGLTITRSGDPNAAPSITLRGPSTLRSGAAQEPFYVVDEVPGADVRLVALDDIATIDVLKDASATAIYGTRASNGVIVITTKKGRPAQTQVNYNSYAAVEKVSRRINMMNAGELKNYLSKNNQALNPSDDQGANTDWQKEVTQTAVSQSHHLALSGGANNFTYNAAVSYLDNKGVLRNTGMNRLIGRASLEQKALNNHLKLGVLVSSSTSNANLLPDQNIILFNMLRYLPTVPVKQADGSYTENLQRVQYYNPVSLQNNAWQKVKTKTTLLNGSAQVILPFGFKYDISVTSQNKQENNGTYYTSQYAYITGTNGKAYRSAYESTKKMLESFLTFAQQLGEHDLNVLGGYSWQEDVNGDGFQASNQNFPTDALGYTNIGLGSPTGNYRNEWGPNLYQKLRLISFYTRVKYNFHEKYLLQASLRRDASSAFGVNNRWATFPSISFAWRTIDESFLKNQQLFSDLKWRVSYGITGNSLGFDPLISKVQYSSTGQFFYNNSFINAIGPSQNDNPDLKWEKTAMFNTSIDFAVWKGKVKASIEYYNKKTSDLIWYYPVSTTQFFTSTYTANVGSISNRGFEITIDATPVKTANFQWISSLNAAHNSNKVLSLSNSNFKLDSIYPAGASPGGQNQTGAYVQVLKSGFPVGQFFTFKYAGKDDNGVSQWYNKDGKLTPVPKTYTDYVYAGSAQPKLLVGLNNRLKYKNFDLNIFIRASLGAKVMNATLADLNRPDAASSYNIPEYAVNDSPKDLNGYFYSNRYIEHASYLRLDNATLGYRIPVVIKGIRSIRIYASGNNLALLTKYSGLDPEVALGGITPGIDNKDYYPRTRSFMVGLNVDF
jgi:iron complex outermembrane receptor protein